MKHLINRKIITPLLVAFLALNVLVANAVADTTWTGAGDGISWNNAANWTGDPLNRTGSTIHITADATNTLGGNGIVSMNQSYVDGGTLERSVNLNAGTLRIDANFETGYTRTFNIGDGDASNGTATVDLNNRYWELDRHPGGNRRYTVRIKSDGTLSGTGSSQIRCWNGTDRTHSIYVEGGLLDVPFLQTGKPNTNNGPILEISSGIARIDSLTRSGRTYGGTLNITGGRFEIGGTAATDFDLRAVNLGNGIFTTKTTTSVWSTAENATLTGNGGGDITFETTGGKDITWNGVLSGAGGLQIIGDGTFTLGGANTYTGSTVIQGGTVVLTNANALSDGNLLQVDGILRDTTGSNVVTFSQFNGASGSVIEDLASLTVSEGSYAGDITGNTHLAKNTAATLELTADHSFASLTLNDGILQGSGNSITTPTLNGAATAEINDVNLSAGPGTYDGIITGDVTLTKTGAAGTTLTLSGVNTYTGATHVTAGILQVDGSLYAGQTDATFRVDRSLDPAAAINFANAQNLANLNLTLGGNARDFFDEAFIDQLSPNVQNLTVESGAGLRVMIDGSTTTTLANSGLTIGGTLVLTPGDLIIDYSAEFSSTALAGKKFTILKTADWTTPATSGFVETGAALPAGYEIDYTWNGAELFGTLTEIRTPVPIVVNIPGLTNPEATSVIQLQPATPGSATALLQTALTVAGATTKQRDDAIQQFTPSMAAAHCASMIASNRMVMQQVGMQLEHNWDVYWDEQTTGRVGGQNSLLSTTAPIRRGLFSVRSVEHLSTSRSNFWAKTFGYLGHQAKKNDFNGYEHGGFGLATGVDKKFLSGRVYGGLAYGYSDNYLTSKDWTSVLGATNGPSQVDAEIHTLLGYSMARIGNVAISSKLGGSFSTVVGNRKPTPDGNARYATDAGTFFAQAAISGRLVNRAAMTVSPKLACSYFSYQQDSYTETGLVGGANFAMQVGRYTDDYCEFDVAIESTMLLLQSWALQTTLGYKKVVGADGAVLGVSADGLSYSVNGVAPATDIFILDLGTDLIITEQITLVGEYNLRIGDRGNTLQGAVGTLAVKF